MKLIENGIDIPNKLLRNFKKAFISIYSIVFFDKIIGVMKMNNNDNEFNAMNGNNLVSVYELISTYGMEAMPQAMEILFNEASW
jgi:hypothetical protein